MKLFASFLISATCLLGLLAIGAEPVKLPLTTGPDAAKLTPQDIETVSRRPSATHSNVWLVDAVLVTWMKPGSMIVKAYQLPRVTTPQLRRGTVLTWAAMEPANANARRNWRMVSKDIGYAQLLATNADATADLALPTTADWPFEVVGELSDKELLEIVAYVRSNPSLAAEFQLTPEGRDMTTYRDRVDGSARIVKIEKKDVDTVEVRTEAQPRAGQIIQMFKILGKWQLRAARFWTS